MIDWFFDNGFMWLVGILAVVLIGSLVLAFRHDARQKQAACAQAWTLARSNADSINVIRMCEIPEEGHITPVVVPVMVR